MATENPILKRNRERAAKLKRQRKKPLVQLTTDYAKAVGRSYKGEKGAEKLRIAKKFLRGKELTTSDEKILTTLLDKLGKKYGKGKGYQGHLILQDWVDNKKGMRSKSLQQAEKLSPLLSTAPIAEEKQTSLDKARAARRVEKKLRSLSPSAQLQDQPPKESASTKKVAKVVPRIVDTGIAFGPRTEKKKISASPIGTVYHGAKSKASVSPRGGVSKAPEVSSRTQTSKEKQLSPFGTAFSNARKAGKDVFTFKGKKYTTELASPSRKRKSPPPAPKLKPKVVSTPKRSAAPPSQSEEKKKETKKTPKPGLMPWNWKRTATGPTNSGPGKREYETLFGKVTLGEDPEETARKARKFEETNYKKGGRIKKGVKKTKAKARRRAALRGHRAELRGG